MTKRRLVAAFVVVSSFAIGWAATPGDHVTMGPPNIVVRAGQGSVSIMANNDGSNALAISGIGQDASCSMTDGTTLTAAFQNFPSNMFTFPVGTQQGVNINCPATGPSSSQQGIRRCEFFLKTDDTPAGRLADFTGVCLYQSAITALSASPSPVNFGSPMVGSSQAAVFTLTTTTAVGGLYYSIMDGEENYSISMPCIGPHCLDPVPLGAGGQRNITVVCSPKRIGNLDTVMHIVGDNGVRLSAPIPLNCSGSGTAGGGEINLSQEIVTLAEPAPGGMQTANVTLQNASATDALVISSMQFAGANSWTLTSAPCPTFPCTIAPLDMVNLEFEFHPSIIDGTPTDNDATFTITSNDVDEGTKVISLVGTGEGTTLVVDSNITPPVVIGPTTAGVPVTRVFTFRNQPATEPLPFNVSISNNPTFGLDVTFGSIAANGTVDVTVTCTPPTAGTHVADFSLMAMPSLGTAPIEFQVECTAVGGTTSGGEINLSQTTIVRAININAGPAAPANVTVHNDSLSESLTITNMQFAGSTAWSLGPACALPCVIAPNDMINLELTFDPSMIETVAQDNNASFTITSSDLDEGTTTISLDGTGQGTTLNAEFDLTPPISVGTGPVGDPITRVFVFSNVPSTEPLPWNASITNPSMFSINMMSGSIATVGSVPIAVTCTPQSVGTVMADFSFMAMPTVGTAPINFTVECTGTAPGTTLSWSPSTIALGDVRIGTAPIMRDVNLDSTAGSLTPGTPVETPNVSQVTLSAVAPTPINMNGGSKFTVTFDPGTVEGPVATTITLAAGTETATVNFSANVVQAQLAAPADVDFGSVCVGQTVAARTLKLVSTGSATIHMAQRPELEAMTASPFTLAYVSPTAYPVDLDTNEEATVTVAPKPMAAGSYVDHLSWMTDATNPRTRLEIDYIADAGGVTPGAVMFAMAQVKQSSAPETVTIQNCAAGTMTIGALAFDPPGEFMAISAVPASLGPGESAEVTLAFTPQQNGVRTSTLTIPTSTGELSVMLSGTGLGGTSNLGQPASLYACDCSSGDPASGFVIVLALVFPLIPRRRRR